MNTLLFVTFAIAVSCAFAYNFEDAAFNKFLVETMDEAYDSQYKSPLVPRNRRAAEGEEEKEKCSFHHHHIHCCGPDKKFKKSEEKKEIKKACFATMLGSIDDKVVDDPLSCEHLKESKKRMICLANCFAEKSGVIVDGEIKADVLKKEIESMVEQEDWQKAMIEPTIEKCLPIAKAYAATYPKGDGDCSPLALKMWHCMWRTITLDCPADKLQTTPICTKLVEVMKKATA